MLNCEISLDSRITVMGFGVLPDRWRAKIPRGMGANIPSRKSGESIGVSGPARKRLFGDALDGGVASTLELSRNGDPEVGMKPGVEGVWGTRSEPGLSPIGSNLTFVPSCAGA